ncbi:MAG: PP2C family protein-serine/threonine phosphatase [Phycisphaerae bacterium]|nr:PP2C family protein-serine/threonine phosphatase [Phycisphaerae bacterium]
MLVGAIAALPWKQRLEFLVETMREMSAQTDPAEMVRAYGARARRLFSFERIVSVSRRGLERPWYRITRSSTWTEQPDPWRNRERLPLLRDGLLSELLWGDEPVVINELNVSESDPAREYFSGMRSLVAIPHYDGGVGLNMVVTMRSEPNAINVERVPEDFWLSNLFGRATNTLVLSRQLREANEAMDREMRTVADIQQSLLPIALPELPTLSMAAFYQTSKNAGGDYYDFFRLGDGRLGVLMADVSGHGTPAAVLMAILHAIAHLAPGGQRDPAAFLAFLNEQLVERYTIQSGTFVTAFYGVYDGASRELTYSCAGHPPPLVVRCAGGVSVLDEAQGLPLGIQAPSEYARATRRLQPGDTVVMYTDGITEARGPGGRMYGDARLGAAVASCPLKAGPIGSAEGQLRTILEDVQSFTAGVPASDDRTILVARVR